MSRGWLMLPAGYLKTLMSRIRLLAIACYLLSATVSAQTAGRLHINEVMVANVDCFLDTSWNYGSWVEIYNSSEGEINLKRYHINTSNTNSGKKRIGYDLVIPAHGHKVLWFGHRYWKAPTQIDAELDNDGGFITLFSPGGNVLDRVEYPPSMSRCSWARCSDGADEWTYTSSPTPAETNGNLPVTEWRMPTPVISADSRFFSAIQSLQVEIPEGATLRYTTDGTTPSRTNGQTSLTGKFRTAQSTVYRFMLMADGYLDSPIVTRSYIRKQQRINMPIVSIVTDPAHLYSDSIGFFVKGTNGRAGKGTAERCNWNMDWDRPVNVEFITQDNVCRLNQEVWMSRCGGHSKGFTPMSFKLRASKDFDGQNTMDYAFFADKPYLRHKALQFRGGGNDFECRIFDAALQSLVRTSGIDIDLQDYQPVAHYINGKFMGTINMREPNNKHNVYANHGLSADEIDMFEMDCDSGYVQKCGTRDAWEELLELSADVSDDSAYDRIFEKIDVDEFCNYMAVELYLGNTDWPQNNCKGWRPIEEKTRFRFVLFDLDLACETNSPFTWFNDRAYHTFCELYDVSGISHFTKEVELVRLFNNLLANRHFALRFADTFSLVGGSVFEPNRCSQLIKKYASVVESVQMMESGYPGRNASPWPSAEKLITKLADRQNNVFPALQTRLSGVLSGKTMKNVSFRANIPQACILLNGQQVPLAKFSGFMFLPATLEATAPEGYQFIGWKDVQTGDIVSQDCVLKLTRSSVRGELEACYDKEYTGKPVVINEVSASNGIFVNEYFKKKDWVELYNPSSSPIDISGMYLSDDPGNPEKYRIEGQHSIIPAGGHKVIWCDNLIPQQYIHANFKLANSDGEMVVLSASDQTWQDIFVYPAHSDRESVGRFPDGAGQLYIFSRPTIEGRNALSSYSVPITYDESPDVVEAINNEQLTINNDSAEDAVYDLSGRKIVNGKWLNGKLQKGIYIVGKKKIAVK